MDDQINNQWQIVSESPTQTQTPAPSRPLLPSAEFNPWQVVSQTTQSSLQPNPDHTTWEWLKDKLSEVFNPNDERNLHPKEVSAGAIARGAWFDPATQKLYDPAEHSAVIRGAEKGITQTLSGTSQLAGKAADTLGLRTTHLRDLFTDGKTRGVFGEAPASAAETSPNGVAEHIGYIGENLMEFISGDEALKGLSLAEKLGLATKIAKLAESHPTAAKLISAGLSATRTGTVSAGQEASHGGSVSDVATAGATGFGSSAASEGLGAIGRLAKPGTKEVANETLQTAPRWKSASTAARLAEANQEPAKRVLANVAHDAADAITQKFGQSAPETIATFRDAAQAVEKQAKPIFEKLDTLSNGQFQAATNELNAANKIARRATSIADLQAAEKSAVEAQTKIDQIFADSEGKIAPEDLKNARSAWRSKKVLEQLHAKIDAGYDMPQSASDLSGAERTLYLSKLQGRLNAAFQKIPQQDLQNVLGHQGTKNLFELAQLGADPARAKTLGDIARDIGSHLSSGGAGVLAGAAIGHAVPGGSMALGIHFLYSHPEAGSLVASALSKTTNPKLIVPAVIKLIDRQRSSEQ